MQSRLILIMCAVSLSCGDAAMGKSYFLSAQNSYVAKDFEASLDYLASAEKNNYDSLQVNFLRGKVHFMDNNFYEAEKYFRKCLKKCPEFTDAGIFLIRSLILQKKFDAAEAVIKDYLVFNGSDYRIHYLAALNASGLKNVKDQLGFLYSAQVYARDSWKVFFENAKIRLALDDKKTALENLICAKAVLPLNSRYITEINEMENQLVQETEKKESE